jgi:hypothetical protein
VARTPNIRTLGWSTFRSDMFGRTKVSSPFALFDSSHRYTDSGDFSYETASGGTHTHRPAESCVDLSVTTSSGSLVSSETRRVLPYQPGKSLQVLQSFTLSAAKAGLRQRVGYFSRENGVFLEVDGDQVNLVLRSKTSGSVTGTVVPQSQWNVDRLDGTGDTDLLLDLSKSQILFIELEWLGVGSVRVGFVFDGVFVTAHQFNHANLATSTYMTTATLPLRYEIENTSATASSSTMKQICASVVSNGGYDKRPALDSVSRVMSSFSTTFVPIAAIRMATGRTDSVILPGPETITPTSSSTYEYRLLRNATVSDGTWVPDGRGNVEYNIDCTSFSGGTVIKSGFLASSNQTPATAGIEGLDRFDLQLGRTNSSSPVSDVLLLVVRTLGGNGTVASIISWYDLT